MTSKHVYQQIKKRPFADGSKLIDNLLREQGAELIQWIKQYSIVIENRRSSEVYEQFIKNSI